jgi:hypothetical protein
MSTRLALIGLGILFAARPAAADTRLDRSTTLEITVTGKGNIHDSTTNANIDLDPTVNRFLLRGGVNVTLTVVDTNPLLFEYNAETKTAESPDYTAAVAFAGALQKLLALFPGAKTSDAASVTVDGFSPILLRDSLAALSRRITSVPTYLRRSTGDAATVAALKQELLDPGTRGLPDVIEQQYQLMFAVAQKCLGTTQPVLMVNGTIPIDCDAPYELPLLLSPADKEAADTQRKNGVTLRQFISLALAMDTRVQKNAQFFREFTNDVAQIRQPYTAATIAYSYKDIQTTTIKVQARTKYQSYMQDDVKTTQQKGVRTVTISSDAYRPAHFSPGAAFVLGFVRNPTFTAVKDGDGFKIVKNEEQLTRYDVAAMLNITPDGWREPTFGGFFQLGIAPKKDEFGFYFGAGLQAQSVFTFGGGLMLQQVRKLGAGLDLTSRLTDPAQLKTTTEFKPGLYLHITVTLPQK